jgi:hypothetical protein
MNMGDAMMLGRGRCCEGTAENNSSGKRNYHLTGHLRISRLSRCGATRNGLVISGTQEELYSIRQIKLMHMSAARSAAHHWA